MKYSKGYRVKVLDGGVIHYPTLVGRTGETKDDEDRAGMVVVFLDAVAPGESHAARTVLIHSSALELDERCAQPAKLPDEFDATAAALGVTREEVQADMAKCFTLPDAAVILDAEGYESLARVLARAFAQAAHGKGKERHAQGQAFDAQPMQALCDLYGPGFALGQAAKKAQESQRLEHGAAIRELLGSIVYTAGAIIAMERHHHA
jgi:hypothetical protein